MQNQERIKKAIYDAIWKDLHKKDVKVIGVNFDAIVDDIMDRLELIDNTITGSFINCTPGGYGIEESNFKYWLRKIKEDRNYILTIILICTIGVYFGLIFKHLGI